MKIKKIEIIGECKKIPNSKATIYIDDKEVWVTNVASDWSINFAIWNITAWSHELLIEIPDLEWNIMWRSDKIFFTASAAWNSGIKSVIVNPEKWLMVWDMTNITAYTDDMIETVTALEKFKTQDRFMKECLEEAEIQIKYDSYIQKEYELAEKLNRLENIKLPIEFDYHSIQSLSYECREKLNRYKPETLGQASRISGISPADINVLAIFLGR